MEENKENKENIDVVVINDHNPPNGTKTTTDERNMAHQGKEISMVAVSPDGEYVVTYSKDDKSIFGWNVDKLDSKVTPLSNMNDTIYEIKVSNHKLIAIRM